MNEHPLGRLFAFLTRLLTRVNANWAGCVPDASQRVYYANHSSHLDSVVIWSALPRALRCRTRPVAAADYWSSGFKRYLALNVFHAILIERHADVHEGRGTVDRIVEGMDGGHSLIIFPEGTRGDGETVAPFKSGIFRLVERCPAIELVPVYVQNANRVLPKGELIPVPFITHVTFGAPIRYRPDEGKHAFLERVRSALVDLVPDSKGSEPDAV
ncbi:MAG TPA: lysophospholipid acyltransferase family protein [Capsulimonadaceae bacterium]|jgi:1-acyl-sn-glycerol-3-phosphate acyltransferase